MTYAEAKVKYGSLERYLNALIAGLKFAELTDITGVSVWLLGRDIQNVKTEISKEIMEDLKLNGCDLVYVSRYNHMTYNEYKLIVNSI